MKIGEKEYKIKTGLTIFLVISTITAIFLIYRGFDSSTWSSLRKIRPEYGLLAGVLMVIYWGLNGLRFQILVKGLKEKVSFWTSLKAFMANLFLGAVTPFQTGGGPLQIYILNRAGIPLGKAFSACLMGAMLTIFSLVGSTILVFLFRRDLSVMSGRLMGAVFSVISLIFLLALALFALSILKMTLLKVIIGRSLNFLTRGRTSLTHRVMNGLDQYSESMSIYGKAQKGTLVIAGLLTLASISTLGLIASAILGGLNIKHDVSGVFFLQFILNFIVYFSPTPGGSGVAEFANYEMMENLTESMVEIYTLIWRFFTYFLGIGIGGLITLGLFRKEKKVS